MKRIDIFNFIVTASAIVLGIIILSSGILKPMRYEIALAIIGVVVTVIGIFIAFEITFPSGVYREDYKTISNHVTEFKRSDTYKKGIPPGKRLIILGTDLTAREGIKILKDAIKWRATIAAWGILNIILLIAPTFVWQINEKNLISLFDVEILVVILLMVFIWIASLLKVIYEDNMSMFDTLLEEIDKIEGVEKMKTQKEDQGGD